MASIKKIKIISAFIGILILLSFTTFQYSEKDLIGTWKIIKIKNNLGSKIDSTAFLGETFTYKMDHSVIHFNPNHPIEQKQKGRWEIKNDTLFQYNPTEKKMPFKILTLNKNELTIQQKMEDILTTIFYKKTTTIVNNGN